MNHLDHNNQLKPLFKVGQLDAPLSPSLRGPLEVVSELLDRPIDGFNIVTTNGSTGVQTYGWKSPIKMHTDGTGYIFLMPLKIHGPFDYLVAGEHRLKLRVGGIYALNDLVEHCTMGTSKVIAAFQGSFDAATILETPDFLENIVQKFKENCFS